MTEGIDFAENQEIRNGEKAIEIAFNWNWTRLFWWLVKVDEFILFGILKLGFYGNKTYQVIKINQWAGMNVVGDLAWSFQG
jgi:hypothetical protein